MKFTEYRCLFSWVQQLKTCVHVRIKCMVGKKNTVTGFSFHTGVFFSNSMENLNPILIL